jgi:hypothetical protein
MEDTLLGLHTNGVTQERTWRRRAGWALTLLPALAMAASASLKLSHASAFADQWVNTFGFPDWELRWVGVLELACVTLYLIPRTAVLGGVLLAAFLGGAVATHVRLADPAFVVAATLGVLAWGGLYLRDSRLHVLLPLRQEPGHHPHLERKRAVQH